MVHADTETSASSERSTVDLAEDAFRKCEYVKALEMMNTPTDYEKRKKSFVELALAREAAVKALRALDDRTSGTMTAPTNPSAMVKNETP